MSKLVRNVPLLNSLEMSLFRIVVAFGLRPEAKRTDEILKSRDLIEVDVHEDCSQLNSEWRSAYEMLDQCKY